MRQPNAKNCSSVSDSRQQQEHAAGKEEADRRAELREHAVPRALARRRVLDRQQHGAAPFAAEAEALAEAAQREQQRRGDADRLVGRQQRRSPPSTRPSSAAPRRASSCGRCDRRSGRTAPSRSAARGRRCAKVASEASVADAGSDAGKNSCRKHQHRRGGVDVEVEELDGRADQAGEQHLARRVDRSRSFFLGLIHRPSARARRKPNGVQA